MRASLIALVGVAAALSSGRAASAPGRPPRRVAAISTSIGAPNEGRLRAGVHLPSAPYLRVVPFYATDDARWGLPALVDLIDRAARRVARRYPDAVLSIGDLSRRGGGEVERHHSHESGRDADLGFYLRTTQGKPLLADRFVPFTAKGDAPQLPGAQFDDARNWALVEALVEETATRVSYIFVAAPIRARLLRFAERRGVPLPVRARAAELMMQPARSEPHDDHFHVRIGCPDDQRGVCIEEARLYTHRSQLVADKRRAREGTPPGKPRPDDEEPLPRLPSQGAHGADDDLVPPCVVGRTRPEAGETEDDVVSLTYDEPSSGSPSHHD